MRKRHEARRGFNEQPSRKSSNRREVFRQLGRKGNKSLEGKDDSEEASMGRKEIREVLVLRLKLKGREETIGRKGGLDNLMDGSMEGRM